MGIAILVSLNCTGVPGSHRYSELLVHTTVKILDNYFMARRDIIKEKKQWGIEIFVKILLAFLRLFHLFSDIFINQRAHEDSNSVYLFWIIPSAWHIADAQWTFIEWQSAHHTHTAPSDHILQGQNVSGQLFYFWYNINKHMHIYYSPFCISIVTVYNACLLQ